MFNTIPKELLLDIAEFTSVNRDKGNNPMGISDEELIERIKLYNKDFDVKKWKEDLKKKHELEKDDRFRDYIDVELNYSYQISVSKPDEYEEVLNTPETLEEYLVKLASYYQNNYRSYFELLTGNWSVDSEYGSGFDKLYIVTNSADELYDMI